jgi:hypothetical protein
MSNYNSRPSQLWDKPAGDPLVRLDDHRFRVTRLERSREPLSVPPFTSAGVTSAPFNPLAAFPIQHRCTVDYVEINSGDGATVAGSFYLDGVSFASADSSVGPTLLHGGVKVPAGSKLTVSLDSGSGEDVVWTVKLLRAQ